MQYTYAQSSKLIDRTYDAMIDWLLECFDDDYEQDEIRDLSYKQACQAINRYFDGGIEEFIACDPSHTMGYMPAA